ncbi:hypothetical protein OHV05_35260 (plasmid) [Kitasatospora sp. NBC_00070]|uniref:hypothetical protein n=1 Tax=Kitasatospora sp. NBC_00070 TaxID=2975962 RepID=UPI002F90D446
MDSETARRFWAVLKTDTESQELNKSLNKLSEDLVLSWAPGLTVDGLKALEEDRGRALCQIWEGLYGSDFIDLCADLPPVGEAADIERFTTSHPTWQEDTRTLLTATAAAQDPYRRGWWYRDHPTHGHIYFHPKNAYWQITMPSDEDVAAASGGASRRRKTDSGGPADRPPATRQRLEDKRQEAKRPEKRGALGDPVGAVHPGQTPAVFVNEAGVSGTAKQARLNDLKAARGFADDEMDGLDVTDDGTLTYQGRPVHYRGSEVKVVTDRSGRYLALYTSSPDGPRYLEASSQPVRLGGDRGIGTITVDDSGTPRLENARSTAEPQPWDVADGFLTYRGQRALYEGHALRVTRDKVLFVVHRDQAYLLTNSDNGQKVPLSFLLDRPDTAPSLPAKEAVQAELLGHVRLELNAELTARITKRREQ